MESTLRNIELLNLFAEPIIIIDNLGMLRYVNDAFSFMLGYTKDEIINENIVHFLQDDNLFDNCKLSMKSTYKDLDMLEEETYFRHKNNTLIPTLKSVKMLTIADETLFFVNIRNITKMEILNKNLHSNNQQVKLQTQKLNDKIGLTTSALQKSQMRLAEVLSSIKEIIWYIEHKTLQVIYVSDAVEKIFGIASSHFLKEPTLWKSMIHKEDQKSVEELFLNLKRGETESIEFRIVREDGSIHWLNNRITYHKEKNIFIGVTFDITNNKTTQDKIEFLAYHDSLTKLPNRAYLKKEIKLMLERSKIISQKMAVLFLDLDNFKYINDSHGHELGDDVLIAVASRLQESISNKGICTRFGGDEFIILLNEISDINEVEIMAKRIISTFKAPFHIQNNEFFLSCSLGISLYPENADSSSNLIKHADTAMYVSKNRGKKQYTFYHEDMDEKAHEFLHIERLIREGIQNDYFTLYFQPLVNSKTHKVEGFEALIRFFHPKEGSISPEIFIPVAEVTGDILPISAFVMSEACMFAKTINTLNDETYFININVSARQFQEKNFSEDFIQCLLDNEVDPSLMKVELTESAVMNNIEIALSQLELLKKVGIQTALDDFGTGYSSFSYLVQLPIDVLKIDKSFVIDLFKIENNRHIIEAVSTMAKAMNMNVVAEGVESIEHANYLHENGIDILQGFLISQALCKEEIFTMLKEKEGIFKL